MQKFTTANIGGDRHVYNGVRVTVSRSIDGQSPAFFVECRLDDHGYSESWEIVKFFRDPEEALDYGDYLKGLSLPAAADAPVAS